MDPSLTGSEALALAAFAAAAAARLSAVAAAALQPQPEPAGAAGAAALGYTFAMITHESPGDTFSDRIRAGAEQAARTLARH